MSKVFKMDKAGRDALLQAVASKFAAATGWAIKESDRKENYTFLDPILKMKAYNEGVRFCVQSSAKTVNMCLEIYSRKDDEVKVHAFATSMLNALNRNVAGIGLQWKVIYKGGLLRIAIPSNKTEDEIVELMKQFKDLLIAEYNAFLADVSPAEAVAPVVQDVVAVVDEVAAPAAGEIIDVIDDASAVQVEADQDLA
jgi:hypothetical protein